MTGRRTFSRILEVLVIKVGGTGLTFLAALMGSRYLGSEQVGLLIYGVSLANLILPVFSLGLPQLMLRRSAISNNIGSLSASMRKSASMLVISALVAVCVMLAFQNKLLALVSKPELAVLLPSLAVIFFSSLILNLLTLSLQGLGYIRISAAIRPVIIGFLTCLVFLLTSPATAVEQSINLAWIHVLVMLAVICVWLSFSRRLRRDQSSVPTENTIGLSEGRYFWYNNAFRVVSNQLPIVILGAMVPSSYFAYFLYASRYSRLVQMILVSTTNVISPQIAKIHDTGRLSELEKLAKWSVKVSLALAIPIIGVMFLLVEPLLALFGDDFVKAAPVLRVLLIAEVINVGCGPVGFLLTLTGNERITFRVNVSTGILAIALCPFAISAWGIMGAAIILSGKLIVTNLAGAWFVRQKLGFVPSRLWKREVTK